MTVRAAQLGLPDAEQIVQEQALRVIVDSQLRTSEGLKILAEPGQVLIATAKQDASIAGAEVISLANSEGKVSLPGLLRELAARECNDVLVEAGAKLAGAFVKEGLVDELVIYMAPKFLGSRAMPMLALGFDKMLEALSLDIVDIRALGQDWRITARPVYQGAG